MTCLAQGQVIVLHRRQRDYVVEHDEPRGGKKALVARCLSFVGTRYGDCGSYLCIVLFREYRGWEGYVGDEGEGMSIAISKFHD